MLASAMFDRFKAWLEDGEGDFSGGRDELELAVAALLIEAAQVDADFTESERRVVAGLLARRFALTPDDAQRLLATAERRADRSVQLFGFTSTVNERCPRERRVQLIEMLWEVAYADGTLDPLEDTLLRRIGGLIDISDHERGEARLRVVRRLGIATED